MHLQILYNMKVTDLMLGDYVRFSITSPDYKKFGNKPFKISTINSDGALALTMDNGSYWVDEEDIEPIPITKEFLDNNFEFDEDYYKEYEAITSVLPYTIYYEHHKEPVTLSWHLMFHQEYGLRIEDDPMVTMKYVHQLQHLFSICRIEIEWKL